MFFELSARAGSNITLTFNEVAKKLLGIDTNPISKSEIKSTGFTLNQPSATSNNPASSKKEKPKRSC